jgi:hypothetical protein
MDREDRQPSPLTTELSRLHMHLGTPDDSTVVFGQRTTGIPNAMKTQVQKLRGQAVEQAMNGILAQPEYEGWTDRMKATQLYRARSQALNVVNKQLKPALTKYLVERYQRNADQSIWRYMIQGEE